MACSKKQRKHNIRYKKSDTRIILSLRRQIKEHRARVTVREVVDGAGLKRGSFYYHYSDVNSAVKASDDATVESFSKFLEEPTLMYRKPKRNVNRYYFDLLFLFMHRNKTIFCQICNDINNQSLLYRMIGLVYSKLEITWFPKNQPAPEIGSERADMLIKMIVEVISRWGIETKCDYKKTDAYITRLLRITNEASMRCG